MIVLGIDFGNRRIGFAKSDMMGFLATGLETYVWNGDMEKPVEHIASLIDEYKIEKIVLGMPRNMDGSYGERAKETEKFAQKIKEKLDIEIIMWDERLTSSSAIRTLHSQGKKTGKNKKAVDRAAACHILQSYLDSI